MEPVSRRSRSAHPVDLGVRLGLGHRVDGEVALGVVAEFVAAVEDPAGERRGGRRARSPTASTVTPGAAPFGRARAGRSATAGSPWPWKVRATRGRVRGPWAIWAGRPGWARGDAGAVPVGVGAVVRGGAGVVAGAAFAAGGPGGAQAPVPVRAAAAAIPAPVRRACRRAGAGWSPVHLRTLRPYIVLFARTAEGGGSPGSGPLGAGRGGLRARASRTTSSCRAAAGPRPSGRRACRRGRGRGR